MALCASTFTKAVSALLAEAYEGPEEGQPAWFSDTELGRGLLGIVTRLTAAQASLPGGKEGAEGSTISAHVGHLRWSLAQSNALSRGERPSEAWDESWSVRAVDDDEWDRLREGLRCEYRALKQVVDTQA